jgi:curved DNA-binding protein CbpA
MDEFTQRMFKVLDIPESASITEIEARYRELVRKCQAAESSGDPEAWLRLKEVSSAYEIVKKDWSERNVPQQGRDGYIRPDSAAPGIAVRKKRSAASIAVVIGLVCIAIVYYGYGFMKKQSPPPAATVAQGELRLFMTSR